MGHVSKQPLLIASILIFNVIARQLRYTLLIHAKPLCLAEIIIILDGDANKALQATVCVQLHAATRLFSGMEFL